MTTHRMLPQSALGWGTLLALVALLAVMPFFASVYYVGLITTAMTGAMLALSLHLLVGATGLVSLGHGAFYGLAAYVVYLVTPTDTPLPPIQLQDVNAIDVIRRSIDESADGILPRIEQR